MPFGVVVVGPPGSGKTTFCRGLAQMLELLKRKTALVNLDPANDYVPFDPAVDVQNLVSLEKVMNTMHLGPNGGLIYCMEFLEKNVDWLMTAMGKHSSSYFIIDCPGQAELYTHSTCMKNVLNKLQKEDYKLTCVHLVDAHHCSDPAKFVAATMLSLLTMLRLELPTINVLSKVDLVELHGELPFGMEAYTRYMDMSRVVETLKDPLETSAKSSLGLGQETEGKEEEPKQKLPPRLYEFLERYKGLHAAMASLIEDFSLVGYYTLNIEDKESLAEIVKAIDKANGYVQHQ